jgi:hypothetical protein
MADSTASSGPASDAPKADESATPGTDGAKPAEAPKADEGKTAEFDGPYDEDRAKRKIEAQAADLKKARDRLAEFEKADNERQQAEMSDLQKAVARAEKAEQDLAERTRSDLVKSVADKHEVPAELLTADTEEALEAQAAKVAELIGANKSKTPAPGSKPKPKLTPASGGEAPEPTDIAGIAARIRRR